MALNLTVKLDPKLLESVNSIIDDEFEIAERKWKVSLTDDQRDVVRIHALDQLKCRIESLTESEWDDVSKIRLCIKDESGELTVPSKGAKDSTIRLIRVTRGWCVDPDNKDTGFPVNELQKVIQEEIEKWTRTAVYYGVSSYR